MAKKTLTLNLSEVEMESLELMAKNKGLTKTALLRQALRLYQSLDARFARGEKLYLEDPSTKDKSELMVL
jgi:hypothetical protein